MEKLSVSTIIFLLFIIFGLPVLFAICFLLGRAIEKAEALNVKETASQPPPWVDVAASAYEAYLAALNNRVAFAFGDLPVSEQLAWLVAAKQVAHVLNGGSYGLDTEQRWSHTSAKPWLETLQ
jgi:hypothetical protein